MLERIIDMAADELGIDPVEIRKRNFIPPDAFPFTTVTGANYDVGEYAKALDEACRDRRLRRAAGRAGGAARARRRRSSSASASRTYVEVTAGGLFQEYGAVEVERRRHGDGDGRHVVARPGPRDVVRDDRAAELLGVPMEQVPHRAVRHRARAARAPARWARGRCRSAGSALYKASEEVLEKAKHARRAPARGERRRHRAQRRRPGSASPACRPAR